MRKELKYLLFIFCLYGCACGDGEIVARFQTLKGEMLARLHWKEAPMTVCNFILLAEGNHASKFRKGEPYYDHQNIFAAVPNVGIFFGSPYGLGTNDVEYRLPNEIHPEIRASHLGDLIMDSYDLDQNGARVMISAQNLPYLDGHKSIFGTIFSGQEVYLALKKGDQIEKVTIERSGPDVQDFGRRPEQLEELKKQVFLARRQQDVLIEKELFKEATTLWPQHSRHSSGIRYISDTSKIEKSSHWCEANDYCGLTYELTLLDGKEIESFMDDPYRFYWMKDRILVGLEAMMKTMQIGEIREGLMPPRMGYGIFGRFGVVPPNAIIKFKMKRVDPR